MLTLLGSIRRRLTIHDTSSTRFHAALKALPTRTDDRSSAWRQAALMQPELHPCLDSGPLHGSALRTTTRHL
ncbi:MAG TPA: hypothetical protein VGH44_02315 [Candidatus Saccharimonadia bacterium]|jgi:hypothetical protein